MGRVINPESVGKERTQLIRSVVLALRELMRQQDTNTLTRDLAAYVALALEEISGTIDVSVTAWEKRGYWLKADRFRMEWIWTERLSKAMREAVLNDDWQTAALTAAQVAEKLKNTDVPQRHKLGTPWTGAWDQLLKTASKT